MPQQLLVYTQRFEDISKTITALSKQTTIIAVSKTQSPQKIQDMMTAGVLNFGENRMQETKKKWPPLLKTSPHVRLHFIGQLQSNKAYDAVTLCHLIHTIDRPSLVKQLALAMDKIGKRPRCFLQVNTGKEKKKGGVLETQLEKLWRYTQKCALPIVGLMGMPPAHQDPKPHFHLLRKWQKRLALPHLSIGMSQDYIEAVNAGSTYVRIGTALFGKRLPEDKILS